MLDSRFSSILKVAVPLMFSSFVESVVLLTDAAFLSRYSNIAYDANGNAGLLYVTFFMAMFGMSDGSQILTARRVGENRLDKIQGIFQTNLMMLVVLATFFFILIQYFSPIIIPQITINQELAHEQLLFLNIRVYALFFAIFILSIQSYFYAIGKTWIVLIGAIIIAISNVFLDYFLIFGSRWFAPMGIEGASLGSTIAEGIGMLFFIIALLYHRRTITYSFFKKLSISFESIKNAVKIGSPLLFQSFISIATWTLFFFWIENMGTDELTVSQNIRSIYFLAFIPIFGFAYTTKTYISQYIGIGDEIGLKKVFRRIMMMSVFFVFVFFHGAIFYPEKLIAIINPNEAYLVQSGIILRFVTLSLFIYAIYSVCLQTVSGSGNTRMTFIIELIGTTCYAIYGYLSIKVLHFDLFWVWAIEYAYFLSALAVTIVYLRTSNWKKTKV